MKNNLALRIGIDIVIAVCVIFGWWYIAVFIAAIMFFKFPYYIELLAAGFAYDALFGMGALYGTAVAASIYVGGLLLKTTIR